MLCTVTHCAGRVLANTRPHHLYWGHLKKGTAITYTKYSEVAGLIQIVGISSSKVPSLHAAVLRVTFILSKIVCRISFSGSCSWRKEPGNIRGVEAAYDSDLVTTPHF